jgi:PPK2 family polyphosphate:nucleotide phosphotransferase
MKLSRLSKKFRVEHGKHFNLADHDPGETCGLDIGKAEARAMLEDGVAQLEKLQGALYAQDRWAVLAIFQAMDAAGKDGAIKHVMSGINPQGCVVHSFKAPSAEELDHDFLWRTSRALPERGRIGIFNRSYYEEVLVVRVHEEILAHEKLPANLVTKHIWKERFEDIRNFESYIARNGVVPIKFFLNVSKEEQRKRFLDRLEEPAKRWKFSMNDIAERERWNDYMAAYEDAIRHTAAPHAPWYVVPADHKWFAHLVIAGAIGHAMEALDLEYPKVEDGALREMNKVRKALLLDTGPLAKKR